MSYFDETSRSKLYAVRFAIARAFAMIQYFEVTQCLEDVDLDVFTAAGGILI
jgi:hypothetical protein